MTGFRHCLFRLFASISLWGGASTAQAAPVTPESILKAQDRLSYSGLLRVTNYQLEGHRTLRMRITQQGPQRSRQEFLQPDGRLADLIISDENIRWHHALAAGSVTVAPVPLRIPLAQRLALLRQNYGFRVLGQLRHLQRLVLLAQFNPRHGGNLTHRLWIDHARHLPLVIERRQPAGLLVDRSEFLGIRFSPPIKADVLKFKIPEGVRVASSHTVLAQGGGRTPLPTGLKWRPDPPRYLPAGYQLVHWQYFLDERNIPTFVWRYHDGLGLLSCFATDIAHQAEPPEGSEFITNGRLRGYEHAQAGRRLLMWRYFHTAYTLVSDLPSATLQRVAESTYVLSR